MPVLFSSCNPSVNAISEKLRKEISLFSCRKLVENVSIMAELPQNIVTEVISSLKSEVFLPNDIIVKAGTPGDCMYFLETGTVSVLTKNGKEVFESTIVRNTLKYECFS